MGKWADAMRNQRHQEAGRLWTMLMSEWLKPPTIDQNYWNRLLDRKMAAFERKEQRKLIDDDQWDHTHQDMNR